MNVVVRTDASLDIGTGHVMRCLVLAKSLQDKGAVVRFVCRQDIGNLCDLIEIRGFKVDRLAMSTNEKVIDGNLQSHEALTSDWQEDALKTCEILETIDTKPDWLVVDHYALDIRWESTLRPLVKRILVIDDLDNRKHDCEILIDQNLHLDAGKRYLNNVPEAARLFVGPRYALLREEFSRPSTLGRHSGKLENLLVYFGGSDPGNQTLKVLQALQMLGLESLNTTILLGPIHPNVEQIELAAKGMKNVSLIGATDKMSELMMKADLAIGTCGMAAWERCLLGLPCIVVITAENQREDASILEHVGAVINLGDAHSIEAADFSETISYVYSNPEVLKRMGAASLSVMEGRDTAMRELDEALNRKC